MTAIKLASLKADVKAENDGDWIEIPELPGVSLKVRSVHYKPYTVARDEATRKLAKQYDGKDVPDQVLAEINAQLYADHILLDWTGFDVEFSYDVALSALSDVAHRDLRNHVAYAAAKAGRRQVEFLEGAAKNSQAPSAAS